MAPIDPTKYESIFKDLYLWFRYFITGALFIIIWYFISITNSSSYDEAMAKSFLRNIDIVQKGFSFITLSLILGSIIYVLHRASLYPIIYRCFLSNMKEFKKYKKTCFLIPSEFEKKYDLIRWENPHPRLSEWASQVHFLYCLSWVIVSTLIISPIVHCFEWYMLFGLILLPLAIWFHYRYLCTEAKILMPKYKK